MNQQPRPTSGLAVASLVCGILGWTFLPLLGSLVAIITGHMARSEIRGAAGRMDGDGLALAGLILGWIAVGLALLTILLVVFFFGGLAVLLGLAGASGQL